MDSLNTNVYKCLPVFLLKVVPFNKKTPVFELEFTHGRFLSIYLFIPVKESINLAMEQFLTI